MIMENKINIAELLKDCPSGMELNCASYDNVSFDKISDDKKAVYPIFCYITDKEGNRSGISFTENGCESKRYGAKCVIFPKGKTSWEGFCLLFKDGDIVATSDGDWIGITTGGKSGVFIPVYCVIEASGDFEAYFDRKEKWLFNRLATEEEKAKLFQAIKDNGYKWNPETKTLEKLIEPIFKVRNKVREKGDKAVAFTITDIDDSCYYCGEYVICNICEQDEWELVPDKFDITTLKPFDKVLVRDNNEQKWVISFFSNCNGLETCKYSCINGSGYAQCIPYEGNEHLLGTTNDCDEYYKTWE